MNIYLVEQAENRGYDTYDSFVCYAEDEQQASEMTPYGSWEEAQHWWCSSPDLALVTLLGLAEDYNEAGVILASFNAG